jgi:hypothetical protein
MQIASISNQNKTNSRHLDDLDQKSIHPQTSGPRVITIYFPLDKKYIALQA